MTHGNAERLFRWSQRPDVGFGAEQLVPNHRLPAAPGRKLGEVLAETIENEIIAAGWRVGNVVGSESELCERYGVSRAVFREAIRIVDHHGVAEKRRGPGGGLVVVAPSVDAAVRTVSLNLEYLDINASQINDARLAIELSCVQSAIENLDDDGERRIRDFLDTEVDRILTGRESGAGRRRFRQQRLPSAARGAHQKSGHGAVRPDTQPGDEPSLGSGDVSGGHGQQGAQSPLAHRRGRIGARPQDRAAPPQAAPRLRCYLSRPIGAASPGQGAPGAC